MATWADKLPHISTTVPADAVRRIVDAPALLNGEGLRDEWQSAMPILFECREQPGCSTIRGLVAHLLQNKLPELSFPNLRRLLLIMLVLPASSAQSERDFSAQNRIKTKARARLTVKQLDPLLRMYLLPRSTYFKVLREQHPIGTQQYKTARRSVAANLVKLFDPAPAMSQLTQTRALRSNEAVARRYAANQLRENQLREQTLARQARVTAQQEAALERRPVAGMDLALPNVRRRRVSHNL